MSMASALSGDVAMERTLVSQDAVAMVDATSFAAIAIRLGIMVSLLRCNYLPGSSLLLFGI